MESIESTDFMAEQPQNFLVVGLGASAGGIQALQEFFQRVPADSALAYVVILHLSPDHDSQLAQVLQTVARIPVTQVTEKVTIEPNHVYVVPPNQHLMMEGDTIVPSLNLYVEERRAPVDIFFRTLADSYGARAVCVVLSGTGANGSMGLKRVKERGGVAYVQNPREAEFNEMPRNAIATDLIDEVLPVAEIPGRILAYRNSLGTVEIPNAVEDRAEQQQVALREIFTHLRVRTGHDFSNYKQASLLRRIERRINVRSLPDLPSYAVFLQQNLEESQALLKDLLISVTNFFRDKKPFQALELDVLPAIFHHKKADSAVRIWVAGCATGEEAYSLAMLVAERTLDVLDAPKVQIFATDIDEAALTAAREGLYTLNDAADVSPERLLRFFTKEGDNYRVQRELREMVLFANHNFLKDPPFSRLDLVTCRNVLIYLNSTAQERVMETFHFALKPGGFLFLGSSESVDGTSDLYATVSRENHIYRSREVAMPHYALPESVPAALHATPPASLTLLEAESRHLTRLSLGELHQKLLEQYAPPSLVVNEEYDILHMSERVGSFLEFSGGEPTKNLLKLIRPELRLALRSVLHQAVQLQTIMEARNVLWNKNGERQMVTIRVKPVTKAGDTAKGFLLVIFEPNEQQAPEEKGGLPSDEPIARQLEAELIQVKAQLRYSAEQYEYQAEELKASNEEFQAVNEELRSAAEELETSKEELQSMNEELRTVNQELKVKIEEISVTSNNFQNLIHSAGVATIFLDRAFCIRLYTPAAQQLFNLIPSDYGRPISDITHRLQYDQLLPDAQTVLEKLTLLEREVKTTDHRAFLMRLLPYRTADDRINGVVITLFDITDRKQAEETLQASEQRLQRMVNVPSVGMLTFDYTDTLLQVNDAFLEMVGYTRSEFEARTFTWLDFTPAEHVEVSQQVMAQLRQTGRGGPYEKEYFRKDGSRLWLMFVAADLGDGTIAEYAIDMSARRQAEAAVASDLAGMQRLHELHTKLATETNLKVALTEMVALACDFTNTDRGCVQLLSDDGQRLELYACHGYEENNRFIQHFLHEGFKPVGDATRRDQLRLIIEDIEAYAPLLSTQDREVALSAGIRALHSVPLITRSSGLVGVLSNQFRQPHRPTEHELRLLDLLAWMAADFVERHRAIQTLEQLSVGLEQQVQERTAQLNQSTEILQKSLAKLQQAEEVAQMGSWEYDIASGETVWSTGMYRLYGLPATHAVSPEIYLDYVVEAEKPLAEKLIQQVREKHEPLDETLHLLIDDQVHTFRIKSVVLRNDHGEPVKMLGLDLDVSEIKRLEEENLQMRLNQQKALLLGILDAQEEERRRIAESLHNGVGQLLFATKLNFDRLATLVPKEIFRGANQLLDEAIQETRKVSHELVPATLNNFGLAKSIRDLCQNYSQTRIRVNCEIVGLENRLEPYLEVAVYRICQELLTNVTKHAEATSADVLLVQEDGDVTLKVRDNGKGVSPERSKSAGIGLRTIKDRVNLLNGTFSLHTPDTSTGTQVTVRIPSTGAS
ncbi:PAS domain-containing protein [Hymenobacter tibetensis]|uniref:PAS domain-containing protein n=1 Tax=Hymenobacter tibetensis TaxID=497967 RepID=A0ABY4CUA5_9BACT|nr:CheR family methyltransferase [Hymenobacter tibetensis]UOG73332.1 PAS domain-containing protein [Hymenobacter tibetensis]